MRLLDKIKGKKEQKKAQETNVLDMVKESSVAKASEDKQRPLKEDTGRAHRILRSGHVSEKANMLVNLNRYVFKVDHRANKIEIAKAVEKAYDVHVIRVNTVNNKGKVRRMGRTFGKTSDWKKAIVTIRPGEKIAGLIEGA